MRSAPMGGDHPHDIAGAGDQWRGLAGVDAGLKIDLPIF